jgi:membrane protease YdiL (CAAX protease family)
VLLGLLASVCVVPLVFGFSTIIEWAYRWLHYQHPPEHELLRAMGEAMTNPPLAVVMVAGAALVVPLWEELMFRGLLQTGLRRMFAWSTWRLHQGSPGFPIAVAVASPPSSLALAKQSLGENFIPPIRATWWAILVTSVLFSVVHPVWSWPAIYLLSVCLGYAYERTGNLWVPVTIHAAFNSTSMLSYLAFRAGAN